MTFRWPWKRQESKTHLVVSWSAGVLAYVVAQLLDDGEYEVLSFGVEHQGKSSTNEFVNRLNDVGLKGLKTQVMLRPEQYQFLQIDAPAVPLEELRSATHYLITDLLKTHIDSVTLDIMRVGDGKGENGAGQIFVVAADNKALREIMALGGVMGWDVSAIDIQETAQRKLQSALVQKDSHTGRANAAIVMSEGQPPILTICANDELLYTHRFETSTGVLVSSGDSVGVGEFVDFTFDDSKVQSFLADAQRSLDLWRRSWTDISIVLGGVSIYAGKFSEQWSAWFKAGSEEVVSPMDLGSLFEGFNGGVENDKALCMPLLGALVQILSTNQSQKINLLAHVKPSKNNDSSVKIIFKTLAFLVALGGCFSTYWVWSLNVANENLTKSLAEQTSELKSIQAAIELSIVDVQPTITLEEELEGSRAQLLQRQTLLQNLQNGLLRPGWGHGARLQLVAQSIPAQVWVTKIRSDETQFEITGFTLEPAALSKWVAKLVESPLIDVQHFSTFNITNTSTTLLKAVGDESRPTWSFSLLSAMSLPLAEMGSK